MSNLVLSLDISTSGTGWALFKGSDLIQSGVLKHKSKSYFERGRYMASQLGLIQSRALKKYDCYFSTIAVEKIQLWNLTSNPCLKSVLLQELS